MNDETATHDHVRASNVPGTNVYNPRANTSARIHYPLPWVELDYNERQDGFVISREQLEGTPRYSVEDEPDWGDQAYVEPSARRVRLTHSCHRCQELSDRKAARDWNVHPSGMSSGRI